MVSRRWCEELSERTPSQVSMPSIPHSIDFLIAALDSVSLVEWQWSVNGMFFGSKTARSAGTRVATRSSVS